MNTIFQIINGRVNHGAGIISGVSVITMGDARGHNRKIDATTLEQVKACAEEMNGGVKVKANHGTGLESIVGALHNFLIDGEQLRADLHMIQSHDQYKPIMEMAQKQPQTFGLSISFSGKPDLIGQELYARCAELYSVDLVDAPAANPSGLFSAVDSPATSNMELPEVFAQFGTWLKRSNAEATELAAKESAAKLKTDFEQATKDLATAKQTIASLSEKITVHEAALKTKDEEHRLALEAKDKSVEELATKQANETCIKMGIPPIKFEKTPGGVGSKDYQALKTEYDAIKDPAARMLWYRKNKAEYDAAFRAANPLKPQETM